MATATVTYQGTRQGLYQLLRSLPRILTGVQADPVGIAQGLQLRLGTALLSKIEQSFITKSRGGTGEDGIKWPPLARSTIIGRRRSPADKKAVALKRRADALTEAERRQLAKDIRAREAELRVKYGLRPEQAKGLARAQIESTARRRIGDIRTIGSILGAREVDILRDIGELLRSFSPGVEGRPSGANGQILRTPPGRVIVGTNKKPWHHRGVPKKHLPARPFWPPDGNLPASWWDALIGTYQHGLLRTLVLLLQGPRL